MLHRAMSEDISVSLDFLVKHDHTANIKVFIIVIFIYFIYFFFRLIDTKVLVITEKSG